MFGVIPKVVWSRAVACDEKNRVELSHNCLLLDSDGGGRATILIEAGTGDKLDAKMSEIFGLDGVTAESAMRDAGRDPGEITHAIVSHLHFDHAGGLTRRVREGETPDWTAREAWQRSGDAEGVKLTFPNAEVICQAREWADAIANDAVMTRTYFADHLEPLKLKLADGRERLRLVDAPEVYPFTRPPHRAEMPPGRLEDRCMEVLPGVRVFRVPGHTWGQQAVWFTDDRGREVVFTPDLLPTVHHAGAAYSLGYDVEPYVSMVTKRWFLHEAAERGWLLVLDHEPGVATVRVRANGSGWFDLEADEG